MLPGKVQDDCNPIELYKKLYKKSPSGQLANAVGDKLDCKRSQDNSEQAAEDIVTGAANDLSDILLSHEFVREATTPVQNGGPEYRGEVKAG
ncbi:MAG: hypothetical protein L3J49_00215 [Desulfobulbaceae bacterium]|nr:hypothetical protein [Desulfobulbaceae bacterium]